MVKGVTLEGSIGNEAVLLAHFEAKGQKVEFGWASEAPKLATSRDLLRKCVLRVSASGGETRYALLRQLPAKNPSALTISESTQNDFRKYLAHPKGKSLTKTVPWHESGGKEFAYLKDNLMIVKIRPLSSRPSAGLEFTEDNERRWQCEGPNGVIMKVGVQNDQIGFTFYPLDDRAGLVEDLLTATYSIILGLNIDNKKIELVRIGDFPKENAP